MVLFRGAYEQVGNTIALWAEVGVNREVTAAWSIPMTWFQALDPLMVFIATPWLVARWARLARRRVDTSSLHKMAFGAAVVGWFVLMTLGELYILPVGLVLFGHVAPGGYRATCIALWFFAGFFGNLLAGWLGTLWSLLPHGAFFLLIGGIAGGAAALLFAVGLRAGDVEKRHNPSLTPTVS